MFAKSALLLAAAAGFAAASPVGARHSSGPGCGNQHFPPPPVPQLPVNGGGLELPAPPSNVTLLRIALGLGIQNYTCADTTSDPLATGALAMLYDITPLFPGQSRHSLDTATFDALPATALDSHAIPLNFDPSLPDRVPGADEGASQTEPFTASVPLVLEGLSEPLPFFGHHFFDNTGVATFDVDNSEILLRAGKLASVNAPANADPGADGTGAVAWLFLGPESGSHGASYVYRVLTAGGNPHGCSAGAGGDTTPYSATYWFYG